MLGQVLAAFGGAVGKILGGGVISTVLRFAGKTIGNYLSQSHYTPSEFHKYGPHLDKYQVSSNALGKEIPLIYGKARVNGEIIWALDLKEVPLLETNIKYFTNSENIKSLQYNTKYLYYADFALAICEGVVDDFYRVWINGEERDISQYKFRFYKGDEVQLPDPFIELCYGKGKTPAFRGLAYIVFENFPLLDFGNKIPNFSFEVVRSPKNDNSLANNIENMVIIPGSGEFVYDTKIQEKIIYSGNIELYREYINRNNNKLIADSLYSLNDLTKTINHLKWVAPVVSWFSDDLDAGKATILPRVEYSTLNTKTTDEWSVAGITRENAIIISKDQNQIPNYGGTVNDASLLRYLEEIRSRNIKIMLYPMIFLDIPGKPWRGHITSTPDGIRSFFNQPHGYKNFILHYAKLAKGKIDAFIIGSELKSITKVKDGDVFPAIEELIDLARKVKSILGNNVIVTYAADWSEYHHTTGGIYNLDPLWASDAIDVIGIDAYFPLTYTDNSNIDIAEIQSGWNSGEGWDYYIENNKKYPLEPKYAWKNIEYWWKNYHFNPDGKKTPWVPKSKKIWFTEFGFPSIDKASNQPNIFCDPNSRDGGYPKYSNGEVDFRVQKQSIKATIFFWKNSPFVEKIFLWTWDARPYPAWPHSKIWRDSNLWLKGHWVNGKLSQNHLSSIITELCMRAGIVKQNIITDRIDDNINGLIIDKQTTIWDLINSLRVAYFFDIKSNYNKRLEFIKRGVASSFEITKKDIVKNPRFIEITKTVVNIPEISICFRDIRNSYNYNIIREAHSSAACIYYMNLPLIMEENEARNLAHQIINSSLFENKIFKFTVMMQHMLSICAGDFITLKYEGIDYNIRVTDVKFEKLLCNITGIFTNNIDYPKRQFFAYFKENSLQNYFKIFELPVSFTNKSSIYGISSSPIYLLPDNIKIAEGKKTITASIISMLLNEAANSLLIDEISNFTIYSSFNLALSPIDKDNVALIGKEVIYYKNLQQVGENKYLISSLIRGAAFTEEYINSQFLGDKVIFLQTITEIPVTDIEKGTKLQFIANGEVKDFDYEALTLESLPVVNISHDGGCLKWRGRAKCKDYWKTSGNVMEYIIEITTQNQVEKFYTKEENFMHESLISADKISVISIEVGLKPGKVISIYN